MTTSPSRSPAITNLSEARLTRLLAQRRAEATRLAETDAKIAALSRQWGYDNGYRVALGPEQVLRAIEAGWS